ncbi:MAG: threonyl-tRNA synthetase [Parcubacteria group bacterium Greene0714_21]|nr:MAG: threonyl-tRNA synthetase [Parcubacteria group bacterium Greene0416_39]TSC98552.1 MAG: threonyl-tRNA synthetase [Parcubacteria group bacterium Greene1014_47]TSD04313.1 MAG: threonyl-tRNA synthetase [Parcubacteria group bacterium Greene0714_21]
MQPTNIEHIRHSFAHLLAAAVKKLYPKAKLGIGPVIENGFYYDFGNIRLTDEDLPKIEEEMRKIGQENNVFQKELWTPLKATAYFTKKDPQPYKRELVKDLKKEGTKKVGMVAMGKVFLDLCRGGHVKNTRELPLDAFKLTRVAGAYWRGSEKNPMLTRVYGLAFSTRKELESHIAILKEAEKRDHRKLGKELELFAIAEDVGPGLPMFYPKGAILRRIVEDYIVELQERKGYKPIWIPHITKGELYKTSGHLDKFDALYPPMKLESETNYYLKPMNCPHFMVLYKTIGHSYRDLPVRWTSTTTNYRYEKSGELFGLTRVRALTQDDCHVFLRQDQIAQEINLMLDMIQETYAKFGFKDFWVRVSTRDPKIKKKYIGDEKIWNESEKALSRLIEKRGWKHQIGEGEAAFYGPKLDFLLKDALGREWQLSTIQLDMNLPGRFKLEYTDEKGEKQQPIVLHRAILGSTERFLGILIEHYAGAFPLWLAPEQIWILPLSDKFAAYAREIAQALVGTALRVVVREENETLGKKIREGELQKIPYLLIVGERETQSNTVSVRARGKGDLGQMNIAEFLKKVEDEIKMQINK